MSDPIYDPLQAGLTLYGEGQPFEAHEAFEAAWRMAAGDEQVLLQALVQVAAARHKAAQGNLRGRDKLLTKAAERLAGLGANGLGLDLVALSAAVQAGLQGAPVPLPARTARAGVLYLHGFASGPSSAKAQAMGAALTADGLEVRVPDLNAGGFRDLTVRRGVAQAERLLFERTLLVGSSLGGYMAALLAAGPGAGRVKAMLLMAPAFDFARRLEARFGPAELARWRATGVAEVEHYAYGGLQQIGVGLYEDALGLPPRPTPDVPTAVLQGARDDVVPADMVRAVVAGAPESWRLEVVDDDHGLVASTDRAVAAARALYAAWCAPH